MSIQTTIIVIFEWHKIKFDCIAQIWPWLLIFEKTYRDRSGSTTWTSRRDRFLWSNRWTPTCQDHHRTYTKIGSLFAKLWKARIIIDSLNLRFTLWPNFLPRMWCKNQIWAIYHLHRGKSPQITAYLSLFLEFGNILVYSSVGGWYLGTSSRS